MEEARRPRIELGGPRCPYCHEGLRSEEPKQGCQVCLAWHHRECWEEHGGCGACVARGAAPAACVTEPLVAAAPPRAVVSPAEAGPPLVPRLVAGLLLGLGGAFLIASQAPALVALGLLVGVLGALAFGVTLLSTIAGRGPGGRAARPGRRPTWWPRRRGSLPWPSWPRPRSGR